MKTRIMMAFFAVSMAVAITGCEKDGTDTTNNADKEFMERISRGNYGATDAAGIVNSKGSEATVKAYANTVSADHSAMQDELKTLAQNVNYKLPSNPDVEHEAFNFSLKQKSGRDCDSAYMNGQVNDHIQMVGICQDEINKGKDPGLKNYASKYLPKMDAHKKSADAIVAAMGY